MDTVKKYDSNVRSLAFNPRKPKNNPNSHTEEELSLIRQMLKRNGVYGFVEVYVKYIKKGYNEVFIACVGK